MKEGYPERVCDLCQLQLNTFHAFVRKAKLTSTRFENMLQELKISSFINELESGDKEPKSEPLSANDIEFELSNDEEIDESGSVELEFIIDKRKVQITGEIDADFDIDANEVEGLSEKKESFLLKLRYMS